MNIYDPQFVEQLFDDMARTYARVNRITSFGFSVRWRRQFIEKLEPQPGMVVCDLMTGMGECWPMLVKLTGTGGRIIALDNSRNMLRGASRRLARYSGMDIRVVKADALQSNLESNSMDCVVIGFGVKMLDATQMNTLAGEMHRILKPGGRFSLIEVSVPPAWLLKTLYLFYLQRIIPLIGWLFLGNPETYRMLGVYTAAFQDCRAPADILRHKGFDVTYQEYFFGCATGVSGSKR